MPKREVNPSIYDSTEWRDLFDSMLPGAFLQRADGMLVDVNASALQMLGLSRETFLSRTSFSAEWDVVRENGEACPGEEHPSMVALKTGKPVRSATVGVVNRRTGQRIWLEVNATPQFLPGKHTPYQVLVILHDVTARRNKLMENRTTVELLQMINESHNVTELVQRGVAFFRELSGCTAVGVRLHDGEDYPYYETKGFPDDFVKLEDKLCLRDAEGHVQRDSKGYPVMECMCGNVICGRFDPSKPFFTPHGSFWTNCTTRLLATTSEADRQARTRNRCNGEGYESVALLPLRAGGECLGLLQLNDRRENMFTEGSIEFWERLAGYLAVGLSKLRAEESLRTSEARYSTLFHNMRNGLAYCRMIDEPGRPLDFEYLEVNKAFEDLTGLKHAPGKKVSELIPGIQNTDQELLEIYGRVSATGVPEKFERYVEALQQWFSVSAYSPGKGYFVAVFDVISEKKRTEAALERERGILAGIMQSTDVMLAYLDAHFNFLMVNHAYAQTCQKTPEELIGRNHFELYPHEENEAIFRKVRDTGETVFYKDKPFEFPDQPERGVTYWDWSLSPVRGGDGKVAGLVFALRETTKYVQDEVKLHESEERFRLTFDQAPVGAAIISLDYRFVRVNEMLCRITGYTKEELMQKTFPDITHPGDLGKDMEQVRRLESGEIDGYDMDKRYIRKDGSTVWIHLVARVMRDASGRPLYYLPTMEDISQRKQDEDSRKLQYDLAMMFSSTEDVQATLCQCLKLAMQMADMDAGGVYLFDQDSRSLRLICHENLPGDFLRQVREYGMDSPNARIVTAGKPLYLPEDRVDFDGAKALDIFRSLAILPIKDKEGAVACLNLGSFRKEAVESATRVLLETIAAQVGVYVSRGQMRDALRRSEESHRALVHALPDIIMRFDKEFRHLFVSGNVKEVAGIAAESFIGKTHRDLGFPEQVCVFWEQAIRKVFASATQHETEFMFEGVNGARVFDWRLVPEFDAQGKVSSVLTIARDVTDHRKAESNYQTLFNKMLDGFALHEIICDAQGKPVDYRFLTVNPAFERITGLDAHAIVGKTVREVLPDTEQDWITKYGSVALTGEALSFENYARELDKYFSVTAFRPAPNQFACVFVDITERRRAEERISAALKEKEVLLRELNHRVKNNLQIIGSLASLQADKIRASDMREVLRESQGRIASIALVHEKLYQSSQLDRIDAGEYFSSLIESIRQSLVEDTGRVRVSLKVDPGLFLEIDRAVNCGLIVNESLTNSLKHAFPGDRRGEVRVSLESRREGGLLLTVSDNGVGLPAGFNLGQTTTLGMEMLRSLADQMGSLHVEGKNRTTVKVAITR